MEEEAERLEEPDDSGHLLLVSSRHDRNCTHEISTIQLPKQDLHSDTTSRHANADEGNFTRPHPSMKRRATGN